MSDGELHERESETLTVGREIVALNDDELEASIRIHTHMLRVEFL